MRDEKKRRWIKIGMAAVLGLLLFLQAGREREDFRGQLLRFHVIAASDSAGDQALKRAVRDVLVRELRVRLAASESLGETRAVVEGALPELKELARRTVAERGGSEEVQVKLIRRHFPEKAWRNLVFPAGNYEALLVTLGAGRGRNWWSLLYPDLCLTDAVHGVVPEELGEELKNVIGEEEYESLLRPGRSEVRIRFRLAELLGEIFG